MTLQQIMYFCEVAKTHNFTVAAQNLYVSQSSLSHAIQNLEQEVGITFFIRERGKKVELSNYGKAFLPYAEQMLSSMTAGQDVIEKMRNPNSGVVQICYSYINGYRLVPMIFNNFYQAVNPSDISIRFQVNHETLQIEHELVMGTLDLAFSCTPKYKELQSVQVAKQELVVMLSSDHPLADCEKLSIQDIADETFIGYYPNWNLSNRINDMFAKYDLKPNVIEFFSDWASQISYVSLGLGIAICPQIPVNPEHVTIVPLDDEDRFRPIYMHWAGNRDLSPATKYVRQYCLDFVQSNSICV